MPPRTPALRIVLRPTGATRYRSHLERADGSALDLEGGSWNVIGGGVPRLPHDLAHLVVERELGLDRGLWGVLAAGGLVQNASYLPGRRSPHAAARGKAVADAAVEELQRAEVLVRAAADALAEGRERDLQALERAVGPRWWLPALDAQAMERVARGLRAEAAAWAALSAEGALERAWP